VRALACVVGYAVWLGKQDESDDDEIDSLPAKRFVTELLQRHPDGRVLESGELAELLALYGIDLWAAQPVTSREEAVAAGEKLGWGVVLKATAERLRERPDQAHVWRNIDNRAEMEDAWAFLGDVISDPVSAGFVVQKVAPPGVPVSIGSLEDPLFGPVISFGISGPLTELLGDRAYRIPPLSKVDAAEMVREIKSAPLLFGYRGGDVADVEDVERLVRRVAQLQNDLPQLRSLDLSLVLAGVDGATVLSASARVEPSVDARSDWFVRRLNAMVGDTLPD